MRNNGPVSQREYLLREGSTLVSSTDLQSHIRYCNPAFIEVSGYTREELIGQPHNLIRHPDMPAEAFRDMWATLKAGEPWTALVKNRRKNGDHYWVRANVTPVLENGRVAGYMSVRTVPSRAEVQSAERLYERMRAPGGGALRLHKGELTVAGWQGGLQRLTRPSLGVQLTAVALAGTVGTAALAQGLSQFGVLASMAGALLMGGGVAWQLRRMALAPLREAIAVARRMSAGDLSQSIASRRSDEVGQLARALTQLNVNLQAIVGDVRREVDGISLASGEIKRGNDDLGSRTETQASNLQQTAASLEEITGTIRKTAETAHTAAGLASEATQATAHSGEAAHAMAGCMDEIRSSSQRIGEIIGTIDGISFQTNILALNAAVEAARAGEAGRGFAVVASEVRALAQRTSGAAREIKTLIEDAVTKVETGTRLAASTGETTQHAANAVQRVHALITEISHAGSEQSRGVDQVHIALSELDNLTQQNAAMVEELAAAAHSLNSQASVVAEAVHIFKT